MKSVSMRVMLLALLATTFSIHQHAHAQGEFVARGAYGLMLRGEMAPDGDRTSYSAIAGFSIKGTLDLHLGYGWLDAPADSLGGHMTGRGLQPGLSLHIIKQGNRYPFSLSALGKYQQNEWDAEMIGADEVTGSMYEIGGMVHTIIQIAEFAGIRPLFAIFYQNREREYAFPDQDVINVEGDDTRYVGGLQIVVMPTARSVLYVGPSVSWMAGNREVGVTGGLVFN